MPHARRFISAFAVASCLLLPLAARGQESPAAFRWAAAAPGLSPSPAAVEHRPIEIDFALLASEAGRTVELPLFDGTYRAVRTSLESRGAEGFTWRGRLTAPGGPARTTPSCRSRATAPVRSGRRRASSTASTSSST
ncbi:MAG TPA: hypothetical protein VGR07_06035 [Thermoanaerobaculia bacterium]|nr:hypothetical protein [Thermoanaerobaculia bacterium]